MNKKVVITLVVILAVLLIATGIVLGILLVKPSCTVSFDSDNGEAVFNKQVKKGELVEEPVAPTKEGFKFLGWYIEENKWGFDVNKVEKDITLKAKWQEYAGSKLEWDTAFLSDAFGDYAKYDFGNYETLSTSTIEENDEVTRSAISISRYSGNKTYLSLSDGNFEIERYGEVCEKAYTYVFDDELKIWTKNESEKFEASYYEQNDMYSLIGKKYDCFEYDKDTRVYIATNFEFTLMDNVIVYDSVKVYIKNDKIDTIEMLQIDGAKTIKSKTEFFNYGTTNIQLPYKEGEEVTKEEWDLIFADSNFTNFTTNLRGEIYENGVVISDKKMVGFGKIDKDTTYSLTTSGGVDYETYSSVEDGVPYQYALDATSGEWVKKQGGSAPDLSMSEYRNIYDKLTFDSKTKTYKGENIQINANNVFLTMEIKIVDGKLFYLVNTEKLTATQVISMECTFYNWGKTVVTLPEII